MEASETYMKSREIEQRYAIEALEKPISYIRSQCREPDIWERSCLGPAIGAASCGQYAFATELARKAMTTSHGRSPKAHYPSDLSKYDLSWLESALAELRSAKVEPYAWFGSSLR